MVVAWLAPRWVTLARDLSFPVERASIVQSHGLSHTLYTTLVAVERNIQHHDDIGQNAVRAEAPDVTESEVREALARLEPLWSELFPAEQARIVRALVDRVVVSPQGADIRLRVEGLAGLVRDLGAVRAAA